VMMEASERLRHVGLSRVGFRRPFGALGQTQGPHGITLILVTGVRTPGYEPSPLRGEGGTAQHQTAPARVLS
jgi:hypothetical protein